MASKRKYIGKTMMDVVSEASSTHWASRSDSLMAGKGKHTRKTMMNVVSEASSATRSLSSQSEAQSCSISGSISRAPHLDSSSSITAGNSDQSSHQEKKTGRGRSKTTPLWESGAKLQLVLTNDGRIDGPHRVQFKTQLGVMARNVNRFPITNTSFKEIDENIIDTFWNEIKVNTTLPDEARKVVVEDLAAKWKQGKYKLKNKSFKAFKDDTKRLKVLSDHCVPQAESEAMIKYWNLEEVQKEAEQNAKNISQYKFQHHLGRMPILEVEKEFLAEGKLPSRIDIFAVSRGRNGKASVNEHTAKLINDLAESISKVPEEERTRESDERVWVEQMGSDGHGRVRCGGQGIKPSQYRHTLSVNDAIKEKIREELRQELKEEIREEREQMRREREQQMEQMREEREQMKGLMEQMAQRMTRAHVVTSQERNEMTQAVVEDVVSYFGFGNFPIGPLSGTLRPFGITRVPDASSSHGAGPSGTPSVL